MKARIHTATRELADVDLESADLFVDVEGLRFEFGTSASHPGHVIFVWTTASDADQVWKFPTRAQLDRLVAAADSPAGAGDAVEAFRG